MAFMDELSLTSANREIPKDAVDQWYMMRDFLSRMKACGIYVPPGSRTWRCQQTILKRSPSPPTGFTEIRRGDMRRYGAMGLELRQLLFAAETLHNDPAWAPLINSCMGGQDIPSAGGDHRPRDHQFHAFMAALLSASGLKVEHKEPDIVAILDNLSIGIAVKRCSSARNSEALLSKARLQAIKSRAMGAALVDVSRLITPHDNVVITTDAHLGAKWLEEKIKPIALRAMRGFDPRTPSLLGGIFTAVAMTFNPEVGCFESYRHWTTISMWKLHDRRSMILQRLHAVLKNSAVIAP